MSTAKIAITLDEGLLERVDQLVRHHFFPNRSKAIQSAVREKLDRMGRNRLARECAKLNPEEERAMADEGLGTEADEWPAY